MNELLEDYIGNYQGFGDPHTFYKDVNVVSCPVSKSEAVSRDVTFTYFCLSDRMTKEETATVSLWDVLNFVNNKVKN